MLGGEKMGKVLYKVGQGCLLPRGLVRVEDGSPEDACWCCLCLLLLLLMTPSTIQLRCSSTPEHRCRRSSTPHPCPLLPAPSTPSGRRSMMPSAVPSLTPRSPPFSPSFFVSSRCSIRQDNCLVINHPERIQLAPFSMPALRPPAPLPLHSMTPSVAPPPTLRSPP